MIIVKMMIMSTVDRTKQMMMMIFFYRFIKNENRTCVCVTTKKKLEIRMFMKNFPEMISQLILIFKINYSIGFFLALVI